ncbi:MAG TPA: HEAT repeat domain-containing protein [Fimbriimonadaceae bacterium]|jgi:HEAT repeat protein
MRTTQERIRKELVYLRVSGWIGKRAETRLAKLGTDALPFLEEATKSKRVELRYRALWAIGLIGTERAVPILAKLAFDQDDAVSYDAQVALSMMSSPRAVRFVYRALASQREEKPLGANLGCSGSYARIFLRRLLHSKDPALVRKAIYMAAQNRHARRLVKELVFSPDPAIRAIAEDALS